MDFMTLGRCRARWRGPPAMAFALARAGKWHREPEQGAAIRLHCVRKQCQAQAVMKSSCHFFANIVKLCT